MSLCCCDQFRSPPALWGCRSVHRSPDPPEPETRSSPPGPVLSRRAPQWTWRRGQRSANQREKHPDGFTHTHTHTGGLVTNRSCWWDFCEDMCSDDIHILQVYVSVRRGQRSPGEGFLDGTVLGLKGQRSVRYLLSEIRPLGRLQALQIETHCCYCC